MACSPTPWQTARRRFPPTAVRALRRAAVALASTAALVPVTPLVSTASAGTYDVYSCKTPSGQPTSTAGWTSSSSLLYDQPGNDCALGGKLTAKFTATGGAVSGGLDARWAFKAPAGVTIASAVLDGSSVVRGSGADKGGVAQTAVYRGAFSADPENRLSSCTSTDDGCSTKEPSKVKVDAAMLGVSAGCAGEPGKSLCAAGSGSRATYAIDSARLTLRDDAAPAATVGGTILKAGKPVRGTSSIQLSATDTGSGVWQAEVRLGPTVVMPRRVVDGNRGRCKTLPGTQAFGWPAPCSRKVEETLSFPTKDVTDGSQLLTVTVWDASNNATVAISQPVSVDNAKRIQADGTIMMPRIADPLDDAFGAGATGTDSGTALQPPSTGSDPQLARIVEAMNTLASARIAYCYGGGHGTTPAVPSSGSYCWKGNPAKRVHDSGATGLDCSSSVSWVLQQAGYNLPTITSTIFMSTGDAGEGKYLTIWTNPSHVYLEVKIGGRSYFWGTSQSNYEHGPGWHAERSPSGFTSRHLPGL
ncbi:MAG: hypothetical protein Q7T55_03155 [Solirubrobacteraceae bacterium]|nr:hypothetical protein [Solirubrobacteraceae bacterium]